MIVSLQALEDEVGGMCFVVISALNLKIHSFTHGLNRTDTSECLRDGVGVFYSGFLFVARLGWWR